MPSTATDIIDGLSTSVAVKAPVKAVALVNITLSGTQTVNGVAVIANDRVLVTNQTSAVSNGIYVVQAGAWTRAKDFNARRDVVKGTLVIVVPNMQLYAVTTSDPITIGTSSITFLPIDIATLSSTAYGLSLLQMANAAALAANLVTALDASFLTPADGNALYQPLGVMQETGAEVIETVADLRTTVAGAANQIKLLVGYLSVGDTPASPVWWDAGSVEADNDGTIFAVAGVATGRWKRLIESPQRLWASWFGALGNGSDDTAAIQAAQAALVALSGGVIVLPNETLISSTITASACVTVFEGDVDGLGGIGSPAPTGGTVIRIAAGVTGFDFINAPNGAMSGMRNFRIMGDDSALGTNDGVRLRANSARCENVVVEGMGRHGIFIDGTASNANCCSVVNCTTTDNYGDGFKTQGNDANACTIINLNSYRNHGFQINEASFLGNTYIGCGTHGAAAGGSTGSVSSIGASNRSVFIGLYTEGGQPDIDIRSPSMVIGANAAGSGVTADTLLLATRFGAFTARYILGQDGDNIDGFGTGTTQAGLGQYGGDAAACFGFGLTDATQSFRLKYNATHKRFYLQLNNSGLDAFSISTNANTISRAGALLIPPQGLEHTNYTAYSSLDCSGTGSPEGVVVANIGSTYRRWDGGVGTCFYVKESGTATNTGWIAK